MNILITGASGYLGRLLVQKLTNRQTGPAINIIAADIRDEPGFELNDRIVYMKLDVRSPDVNVIMAKNRIDTVVHLASIVTPGKKSNREFEYSVDVLGTENILKACVRNKVKRIIVTSSGAAYGYHKDNPEWITEKEKVRGNEEFAYAHHKKLVEQLLEKYRFDHPELEQTIFRIGTILGKTVNNQITALFEKKVMLGISGSDSPFVFIWDQDVVGCLEQAVFSSVSGIFNVAGDGKLTVYEIADILNKPVLKVPAFLMKAILFVLKRLSLTQYGEEQVNFLRYRPVLDNTKLKTVFGYTPAYTSKEVFDFYITKNERMKDRHFHHNIKSV